MKKDKSLRVPQRDKVKESFNIIENFQFSEKQQKIIDAALQKNTRCLMIDGIWGSSKTYLATYISLKLLAEKRVSSIIYIRNPIESSTTGKVGFLKGELDEKMAPYNAVLEEKLDELLDTATMDKLIKDERVECIPLGHVRGRSWNCKAIIVDEAASMTFDDLLLLLTRCGEFTRIFLIGDSENQNDIGKKSGFHELFQTFSDEESSQNGVHTFEMREESDIVRSGFVRFVMRKTGKIKR